MKPPKKCMKMDQVLNALFDSEESDLDASNSDSSDSSEPDSFQNKHPSKSTNDSDSLQARKGASSSGSQHRRIEDLLDIKATAHQSEEDDEDDIPLGKLVSVKIRNGANILTETTNFVEHNNSSLRSMEKRNHLKEEDNEDDDDDEIPLAKLVAMQKNNALTSNKSTERHDFAFSAKKHLGKAEAYVNKLRRLGKTKSMRSEDAIDRLYFLKGLFDFDSIDENRYASDSDCEPMDEAECSERENTFESKDISFEFVDMLSSQSLGQCMGLKSPIIKISTSSSFVLSIKNLKRKKSSKQLSNNGF